VAEIHVEKKPRSGWIWLLILLILVAAVLGWLYWNGRTEPAPATGTSPATVTESAPQPALPIPA
jgi:lipopolysaccharide export system protein LptC